MDHRELQTLRNLGNAAEAAADEIERLRSHLAESNKRIGQLLDRDRPPARLPLTDWQPIETAPDDMAEPVVVRWIGSDGAEQRDLDYKEDGCWMGWHDHAEHVEVIGGHGVSYTPPYLHWLKLPEPPNAQAHSTEPAGRGSSAAPGCAEPAGKEN